MRSSFWVISMVLVCTVSSLLAQGDRGIITGTVKDSSGAVVPDAQVTAIHVATSTNYKTRTSESGYFTVPSLPVGTYHLRVEDSGFQTVVTIDIVVAPGATVNVDSVLEVGAAHRPSRLPPTHSSCSPNRPAWPPRYPTRTGGRPAALVNAAVRSPFDLSSTTAEVSGTGQYRVGGGKGGAYGMTLDGSTITTAGQLDSNGVTWTAYNTPSVDALTEFSVTSGGFKADIGHASGGSMSFVSKSGTNEFHGDFYEFLRNT